MDADKFEVLCTQRKTGEVAVTLEHEPQQQPTASYRATKEPTGLVARRGNYFLARIKGAGRSDVESVTFDQALALMKLGAQWDGPEDENPLPPRLRPKRRRAVTGRT